MRLKIIIIPKENFLFTQIRCDQIQGLIWNLLKNSEYSLLHDIPKFKYFCFSEIFPPTDFIEGEEKIFFISSPDKFLIKVLHKKFKELEEIKLGYYNFEFKLSKPFDLKFRKKWISGSPIVLQVERNIYWSKKSHSLNIFLKRLKDNALKKHNSFYKETLEFNDYIFDSLILKKQVAVSIRKDQKDRRIIGTKWIFEKRYYPKELRKFYKFILDCGLGEKNSIGFGFVNPI